MKKIKYLVIGSLCVLSLLMLWLSCYTDSFKITDFNQADKAEERALDLFYTTNSKNISKGKVFDLKYTYFDKFETRNSILEIVKKTDVDVGDIEIQTVKKNDEPFITRNYGKFGANSYNFWSNERVYLKFIVGNDFLKDHSINLRKEIFITNTKEYGNFTEIKVIIRYRDSEETHTVKFEENDVFENLSSIKGELSFDSKYEAQLLTYYYGLLFERDFSRWCLEVEEVLNSKNIEYLQFDRIFHIPCDLEYHDLQSIYNLNDDEFVAYKTVIMEAIEKGGLYEQSGYVKKLLILD
ncbi:hypothetical protein [Amedibacillus sp. YH-ame10]